MSDHVRKSNTASPAKRRKTTEKDKNCDIRDYVCSIPMKDQKLIIKNAFKVKRPQTAKQIKSRK